MIQQPLPLPSWDELFMRHAYLISSKSRDNRTKVGAAIVRDKYVISEGYNGFPRGVDAEKPERYERPEKYFWFEHAERNSVFQCARHGIPSNGTTIFTQGIPCADCARAVIQAGIIEVVVHKQWQEWERKFRNEKWVESHQRSSALLHEANVSIRVFDGELNLTSLMDGKIVKV
jgi:dCMP deaminase